MIPFWTEIVELMAAVIVLLAASDILKKTIAVKSVAPRKLEYRESHLEVGSG
ncbi:MAG: hypothetical protein AAF479_17650 [Pseudomonadota bacterium]